MEVQEHQRNTGNKSEQKNCTDKAKFEGKNSIDNEKESKEETGYLSGARQGRHDTKEKIKDIYEMSDEFMGESGSKNKRGSQPSKG